MRESEHLMMNNVWQDWQSWRSGGYSHYLEKQWFWVILRSEACWPEGEWRWGDREIIDAEYLKIYETRALKGWEELQEKNLDKGDFFFSRHSVSELLVMHMLYINGTHRMVYESSWNLSMEDVKYDACLFPF